jgi:hypothetical protein
MAVVTQPGGESDSCANAAPIKKGTSRINNRKDLKNILFSFNRAIF